MLAISGCCINLPGCCWLTSTVYRSVQDKHTQMLLFHRSPWEPWLAAILPIANFSPWLQMCNGEYPKCTIYSPTTL